MKALTLQRPWAAAFLLPTDPKRIENRKWKPPASVIGHRIALHSGLGFWPGVDPLRFLSSDEERECWANYCTVTGVFATAKVSGYMTAGSLYGHNAVYGRWWLGPYAWVLTEFRPVSEPIACNGAQGLWNLPDEIAAQLEDPA